MPGGARKGQDSAGAIITGGSGNVNINGKGAVRIGDAITGHGTGPHAAPTMAAGSSTVKANGIGISRAGDAATCGHAASGSGNVNIGG